MWDHCRPYISHIVTSAEHILIVFQAVDHIPLSVLGAPSFKSPIRHGIKTDKQPITIMITTTIIIIIYGLLRNSLGIWNSFLVFLFIFQRVKSIVLHSNVGVNIILKCIHTCADAIVQGIKCSTLSSCKYYIKDCNPFQIVSCYIY